MRVAVDELVVDAPADVGEREGAPLGGEHRVEHDLEQQVAELLLEVRVGLERGVGAAVADRVEGLEHLVGLLDQVAGEGGVGLLGVPGALGAQGGDQLDEPLHLPRHRRRQLRYVEGGEVVGLDRPVEVVPRDLGHGLVGQAQPLQHDHRLGRAGRPRPA